MLWQDRKIRVRCPDQVYWEQPASHTLRRCRKGKQMKSSLRSGMVIRPLLPVFGLCLGAFAQETTTGFQGTVKDSTGGVIANATAEVSGPALIGSRKVQTDATGIYRFAALPPGVYTLT